MVIAERPDSSHTVLIAVPLLAIAAGVAPSGSASAPLPWLTALVLSGAAGALMLHARVRLRSVNVSSGSVLVWQAGVCGDDTFSVALSAADGKVLLEHEDPAVVLSDARRLVQELGCQLVGAPELVLDTSPTFTPPNRGFSIVAPAWQNQHRAAQALLLCALFVAAVVVLGILPEPITTAWLSRALPLIGMTLLAGGSAWLLSLRTHVSFTTQGISGGTVVWGRRFASWQIPLEELLSVKAFGHPGHAIRRVVFETRSGPRSVLLAGSGALRVVEAFALKESAPARSVSPASCAPLPPQDSSTAVKRDTADV